MLDKKDEETEPLEDADVAYDWDERQAPEETPFVDVGHDIIGEMRFAALNWNESISNKYMKELGTG